MKKILSLILSALVLCSSCSKNTDTPSESDVSLTETAAESSVLTNVFRGTEVEFPADFEFVDGVIPCYDTANGTVTVFGETGDTMSFLSFDPEGQIVAEHPVNIQDSITQTGVLTSEAMYILCYDEESSTDEHYIMRYSRTDDSCTYSEYLSTLFDESDDFYRVKMAVDPDGYVYIESDLEIVVLTPDLQYTFAVMADSWVKDMPVAAGAVCVQNSTGIQKIDKKSKRIADMEGMPQGTEIQQYCSGEGYDLYYTNDTGLYGWNFSSDELPDGEAVLLCDWQNSNLFADNVRITNIISPDCVVMYNDDWTSLVIFRRSEDIDLSKITTLEIAYAQNAYNLPGYIVQFNKENPDVRLIARDYSVYDTDVDRSAGEKKLINDMLTGVYKPDIVYGHVHSDVFRQMILENKLYTDLYTFMENDPDIKKDDLLGSIRRMCESEDGALMMLPGDFSVSKTLIAPESLIGDRISWTLPEMLDFIETLPEDVLLLEGLTQANAASALFGGLGYRMFIDFDAGTCSFEGEEFLRYLRILKTLPEGDDKNVPLVGRSPDRRDAYLNGGVALKTHNLRGTPMEVWMHMYTAFGTEDTVPIGYASSDDTVSNAQTGFSPYMIPTTSGHPEEAWRFLKSVILSYNPEPDAPMGNEYGYPILRSQFQQMLEPDCGTYYEIYLDGTMLNTKSGRYGGYDPTRELRKPGFRMQFDEAEAAKMLDWFDNKIGLSLTEKVPSELSDIINEEISAFLSGVRTAENCAEIIQSRVSIWLAEHE